MNRQYITKEPIIIRIKKTIEKTNSSFGNYCVGYYIKWNRTDKHEIGTYQYFMTKKEAKEWIEKHAHTEQESEV